MVFFYCIFCWKCRLVDMCTCSCERLCVVNSRRLKRPLWKAGPRISTYRSSETQRTYGQHFSFVNRFRDKQLWFLYTNKDALTQFVPRVPTWMKEKTTNNAYICNDLARLRPRPCSETIVCLSDLVKKEQFLSVPRVSFPLCECVLDGSCPRWRDTRIVRILPRLVASKKVTARQEYVPKIWRHVFIRTTIKTSRGLFLFSICKARRLLWICEIRRAANCRACETRQFFWSRPSYSRGLKMLRFLVSWTLVRT